VYFSAVLHVFCVELYSILSSTGFDFNNKVKLI
jgi:hypothetical protein